MHAFHSPPTVGSTRRPLVATPRVHAVVLAAAISALALAMLPVGGSPAEARGSTNAWTAPTAVAGSEGWTRLASATAPDGATAVVWREPGTAGATTSTIMATVRLAGHNDWIAVSSDVDETIPGALHLVATSDGDFWLSWLTWTGEAAVINAMRLNVAKQRWTAPTDVYGDFSSFNTEPRLAVSGDGTVTVATAGLLEDFSDAVVIATRSPDGTWTRDSFNVENSSPVEIQVAAGPDGDQLVTWTEATLAEPRTISLHTVSRNASTDTWAEHILASATDPYPLTAPAIGSDGTAAVGWLSPFDYDAGEALQTEVHVATVDLDDPADDWTSHPPLAAGETVIADLRVAVDPAGRVATLWTEAEDTATPLKARVIDGDVISDEATVSSDATPVNVAARPRAGFDLLYYQPVGSRVDDGLWVAALVGGRPGVPTGLTTSSDGVPNYSTDSLWSTYVDARLSSTAAGALSIAWGRVVTPSLIDIREQREELGRPVAMTTVESGIRMKASAITGAMTVGSSVRCRSGFWVEARDLTYRWLRNGKTITSATRSKHRLTAADRGSRVSCKVIATNDSGLDRILISPSRRVRTTDRLAAKES